MDRVAAHKTLRQILRQNGASLTAARLAVFDALFGREALTMHQLVESLGSAVDRASIYRTIDLYEKLSIVERVQHGWKYSLELSDMFSEHHHHLVCSACDKIIRIDEDAEIEQLIQRIGKQQQFTPTGHRLEIRGLCAECS